MRSSPWATLLIALRAAFLLLLVASQLPQPQEQCLQLPRFLFALGGDSGFRGGDGGDENGGKTADSSNSGASSVSLPKSALDQEAALKSGLGSSLLPAGKTKDNDDAPGASEWLDVQTAQRLVQAVEEASKAAAGAVAAVEAVLKHILVQKQACEAQCKAAGEEISSSSARLQEFGEELTKASDSLIQVRDVELAKFREAVEEIKQLQDWHALAQSQQTVSESLAALEKRQDTTTRDLEMLNSSYLSLEGDIHEQLKTVLASAKDASASSYKVLSERFREMSETKVEEIQQAYNSHRLDELAIDRSIVDMVSQLKEKGVAVIDISDVFPSYGFEAVRKEFMVRVAKRVRAFFLPVFIVTQTQEEFSDWLYTRYHLVPSMRMIENIIDELSFVNNREAYAVVRVESVSTSVFIRRVDRHAQTEDGEEGQQNASEALRDVGEREKLQLQSLTEGHVLPFSQPSYESLVMARGPFFGAEVVKIFDPLTKAYLRTMVGGHLKGRAVLIVYMGDRKGEIARPMPTHQEVLGKLDLAEKLCSFFSVPLQEVAALWRQMEAEIPFYSTFFRTDPVVFGEIPVSFSFESAKLPPLPPSPLFRGDFGVVQIQALCKAKKWIIPSSRALLSSVSYVNNHSERGGVQAIIRFEEEKVTTFWRSKLRHVVHVTIRSADVPRLEFGLGAYSENGVLSVGGKDTEDEGVVYLDGEGSVQQYLTQAVARVILPSIGARATFRRLLFHICVVGKTC